jgi:DNA repair photolyase
VTIKGRGAGENPANRFEKLNYKPDVVDPAPEEESVAPKTEFFKDFSKSILAENSSPDIGFRYSINPYRGCEHGCAYCYARPTHEYLGLSAGLDFESKIFVKENAPELLREKLLSKSWRPEPIMMSGNTDCYQPAERRFRFTRRCLEILAEFRNPVSMITKNQLVTRDIDVLKELNKYNAVLVFLSITTLDRELAAVLEPRTSRPEARLNAVAQLSEAGIPVGVNAAPMIPGLNDHEMPKILKAAAEAGARVAGYTPVRLPLTVLPVFTAWLEAHRPLRKEKVLNHIRDLRGGKLNDAEFGSRMRGQGPIAEQLRQMFHLSCTRYRLNVERIHLSTEHFRRAGPQLDFFDSL